MAASANRIPTYRKLFGLGDEEFETIIRPMTLESQEPVGSMGDDTPMAVLSLRRRSIYSYNFV